MWASWGEIVVVLGVGAMLYVQRMCLRNFVRTAGAAGCRDRCVQRIGGFCAQQLSLCGPARWAAMDQRTCRV
jgi:hypothetical protein